MIKKLLEKLKVNAQKRCVRNCVCPCCKQRFVIGEDDRFLCRTCDISFDKPEGASC